MSNHGLSSSVAGQILQLRYGRIWFFRELHDRVDVVQQSLYRETEIAHALFEHGHLGGLNLLLRLRSEVGEN